MSTFGLYKTSHSTSDIMLITVLVAREYIQEMLGVNSTVGKGFLGPLWIYQLSGSAAGILSIDIDLVKTAFPLWCY